MPNIMSQLREVTAIVLTWNALDKTKIFFETLKSQAAYNLMDIVTVDNASTDGTLDYLQSLDAIDLIRNESNLGYARGVNIGIQASRPESDILLLNNDLEFIDEEMLAQLFECQKSPAAPGVMGVKILRPDLTLQHCGAYLPVDTAWGQQLAAGEIDINQYGGVYPVESVVFACVYIRREVIDAIGLLDERFFAYFEDTDFCLRAMNAGFQVAVNGNLRVLHHENSSTTANDVSHEGIFLESQKKFKEKWYPAFESQRYSKGSIDLHSIINFPTGYASSARSFTEALDGKGVRMAYKYVYGEGTPFPVDEPRDSDSYIVNMVRGRKFGSSPIQVVYGQGDVFYKNTGDYKIGFTMLEVTGIPREWASQANMMDEVWVPSSFNLETFRASGVLPPIKIVPLGIDPTHFHPEIKGFPLKETYTFLSIFEWGERKAPELLLKAFSDEFTASEDVVLVCKVGNRDATIDLQQEIGKLRLRSNGGKIRIALNKECRNYEMGVMYRSADCFVLPTRGEGWGMPFLEAMACGLPTIGTNWSSNTDFMNDQNSLLLEVESLVPAEAKCPYYDGFQWAQPSYEHLRQLMRWTFENRDEARAIGDVAAKDAAENWTWANSADVILDAIQGH